MNRCLRHNFYTQRFWINFFEMVSVLCYTYDVYGQNKYNTEDRQEASYELATFKTCIEYSQIQGMYAGHTLMPIFDMGNPVLYKNDDGFQVAPHVEELFKLLKLRFREEYCFDLEKDYDIAGIFLIAGGSADLNELRKLSRNYIQKMLSIYVQTYERYAKILDIYSAEKENLLNKVEAITRFNDTPQDSGEFSDDSHTTHITSSRNDYDTLMGRIDEIDRKYRNVLKDWTNEFEPLFIHEESL